MICLVIPTLLLIALLFDAANASGYMVQSAMGNREMLYLNWDGDFDVVAPASESGLQHWWRPYSNLSNPNAVSWRGPKYFGKSDGKFLGTVSLLDIGYGQLFLVGRVGSELIQYSFSGGQWYKRARVISGASGSPAMVKGRLDRPLKLVVPLSTGGIGHYNPKYSEEKNWDGPLEFGKNLGNIDAVTLTLINNGTPGELKVIARVGNTLHQFYYEKSRWYYDGLIATGVRGQPSLIQSSFGGEVNLFGPPSIQGNFELISPLQDGGLGHWYRDNNSPSRPWRGPKLHVPRALPRLIIAMRQVFGTPCLLLLSNDIQTIQSRLPTAPENPI
ncbi:uncharacterized protein VTP21DRAFT_8843 [Calcarisporiella thermophila]|uniref:uncharacterized protein n=1 Tax=Calcarisporiella thermophila TaxID=911321 RepID=UPI00374282FC